MRFADLHVDTLNRARERGWDILHGVPSAHVDIPRFRSAGGGCLGLSLWADPGECAPSWTRKLLGDALRLAASCPGELTPVVDVASLERVARGDIGLLLTVEGAHGISDSLEIMQDFVERGVRSLTLTWNNSNGLADSSTEPRSPSGLTSLGRRFVVAMQRWGCVVDLSHVSKAAFWDAIELAADRVWVSHSACEALAPHPRNVDDEQIRALAQAGSVVGIVVYPVFLGPADPWSVTLETVADHIEHVALVGGPECVAIGSDFDGISQLPQDVHGVEDLPRLFDVLRRRGWSEDLLEALCWNNPMRVLERSLPRTPTVPRP